MLFLTLTEPKFITSDDVDGYELRIDLFHKVDRAEIARLKSFLNAPVIFTFKGEIFRDLLELEPDFIDLEHSTSPEIIDEISKKFPNIKIILSYHNLESSPDPKDIFLKMQHKAVYAYKIVTRANSAIDSLRILDFIKNCDKRVTGICVGDGGVTRILGPIFGSFSNYTYIEEPLADGQISLGDLTKIYKFRSLNSKTKIYGLIGDPVEKSVSHLFHNSMFKKKGKDAVYVKMRVKKEELPKAINLIQKLGFSGLSVTMPLKEEILKFIENPPEERAVNTIKFENDKILGFNTDGKGALDCFSKTTKACEITYSEKITSPNTASTIEKICILGAGGAAKAIAYEAKKRGLKVTILNRTIDKALKFSEEIGCAAGSLEELRYIEYHVLVNATPSLDPCPDIDFIPGTIVMDIKNRAGDFLTRAKNQGCKTINGEPMFFNQALEQQKIWD